MTPDQLRAIGTARYGTEWQSPLARALGMSPRHMRRLLAGDRAITPGIEEALSRVIAEAVTDLSALLDASAEG